MQDWTGSPCGLVQGLNVIFFVYSVDSPDFLEKVKLIIKRCDLRCDGIIYMMIFYSVMAYRLVCGKGLR